MTFLLLFVPYQLKSSVKKQLLNIILISLFAVCCVLVRACVCVVCIYISFYSEGRTEKI